MLVLRYKRRRRDRRSIADARGIGYPGLQGSSSGVGVGGYEKGAYAVDIKEPEPAVQTQRVGFATAVGANRASFHLKTPPKGKYSVFPRTRQEGKRDEEAASPSSEYSVGNEKDKAQSDAARKSKLDSPPSLDKWLRAGTNVSPFGTLNVITGGQEKQTMGKNWPLDRKGSS